MRLLILLIFAPTLAYSHGGAESEGPKIGKGIIAYDKHDGFKLSPESLKRMKFAFAKVATLGTITIPKNSLVHALNEIHLFIHTDGFFKPIDVKITAKLNNTITVTSPHLKIGTEVVVTGVSFLRVIEMDLGSSEDAHSEEDESNESDKHQESPHKDSSEHEEEGHGHD